MEEPTAIYLPNALPYPLKIHRLLVPASSTTNPATVSKTTPLFSYSYQPLQRKQDTTLPDRQARVYESPVGGDIVEWCVREGQELLDAR